MNWILCDIGNSRIKIAKASCLEDIQMMAIFPTSQAAEAGAAICNLAGNSPIAVCSVVSQAADTIKAIINRPVFQVTPDKQQEIINLNPGFGTDRVADMVAAKQLYAKEKNFLVVGLGSATVLTAVSSKNNCVGGFITLGMVGTLDAISVKIPALPAVSPDACITELGSKTIDSIGNGTLLAQVAMVERWIEEAKKVLDGSCVTVATGGCLEFVGKHTRFIDHFDPLLTLKGTYIIAQQYTASGSCQTFNKLTDVCSSLTT